MANFGVDCSEWLMNLVIIKPIDKEQLMVINPKKSVNLSPPRKYLSLTLIGSNVTLVGYTVECSWSGVDDLY